MRVQVILIMFSLLFASASSFAGQCSAESVKRGCRAESYDCDRPTHYTCTRCVCDEEDSSEGDAKKTYVGRSCSAQEIQDSCHNDFRMIGNPNADHWVELCICE